ncbi:1933_t:CDS:2, partial [Entrophospora sp. SA101]
QSAGHLIGNGCQNGGHRQGRSDNTRGKHMGGAHRHADEGGRENSHRRCDFSRRAVLGAHRLVRQLLADNFAPGRPPEACRDEAESLRSRTCALWQGFDGALSPLWTALGQLIVTEAFETSVANGFGNSTLAGTL